MSWLLQGRLPASHVVMKALNMTSAAQVPTDGTPEGTPNRRVLTLADDDADARKTAADLYHQAGVRRRPRRDAQRELAIRPRPARIRVRQNAGQLAAIAARRDGAEKMASGSIGADA